MSQLTSSLRALRALSALFLKRLLHPVFFMIVILTVAVYVTMVLLSITFSAWWWLLLIVLIPLTVFFALLSYMVSFLLRKLIPRTLTSTERSQLNEFTDKLFDITERTHTPYPILLLLIAKDVIRGRESSFLRGMIGDSKALVREFSEIQKLFRS